jgi:hypothetical protein
MGFAAGTIFGLYYAQNYPAPDVQKEWEKNKKYFQEWQNHITWKDPPKKDPS